MPIKHYNLPAFCGGKASLRISFPYRYINDPSLFLPFSCLFLSLAAKSGSLAYDPLRRADFGYSEGSEGLECCLFPET